MGNIFFVAPRNKKIILSCSTRDQAVRCIRALGKKAWKEKTGYHRRSLVDIAMFRLKKLFTAS